MNNEIVVNVKNTNHTQPLHLKNLHPQPHPTWKSVGEFQNLTIIINPFGAEYL